MPALFSPEKPYNELVSQAIDDLAAFYQNYGASEDDFLLALPEVQVEAMKHDPEVTKSHLKGTDRKLRLAALVLIRDYWDNHPLFAPECLRIAFEDPDVVARALALLCLPYLYCQIDDPHGTLELLLKEVVVGDIEPLRNECEPILQQADETLRWVDEQNHELWREVAGNLLDQMLSSPSGAEAFLAHEDPEIRWVALGVLLFHWRPTRIAADSAEVMATDDAMPQKVRAMAYELLADFYRFSNDPRIGRLLARIVVVDDQDPGLRKLTYLHLHDIRGISSLESPNLEMDFPGDVNWAFVHSFLGEPGGKQGVRSWVAADKAAV